MFNLNSLSLSPTTEMELTHPVTGEVLADENGNAVTFTLYGSAARQYQLAVDAMMRKRKQRGNREASPAEARQESAEFLAALSVKVANMEYNDAPIDNKEAFVALYSDEGVSWIREQVNSAITSVESFLKK